MRMARFGFLAGILVGVGLGWFFHGVVSLVLKLGVLAVILVPLLVIGWLWWRSSRTVYRDPRGATMVWSTGGFPRYAGMAKDATSRPESRRTQDTGQIIDLNDLG